MWIMSFLDYMWFDEEANVMPTVPTQTVGVVQDVPNGTFTINTAQAVNRLDDLNRAINAEGQLIAQQQQAMGQLQINVGAGGGGGTGQGGLLFGQQQNNFTGEIYNPPPQWWGQQWEYTGAGAGLWQGTADQAQELPRVNPIPVPTLRYTLRGDWAGLVNEPEQPRRPRRKLNLPDWF